MSKTKKKRAERRDSAPPGQTNVSANGYHYTKVEGRGFVLTHHLIAEEQLGRRLDKDTERVIFLNPARNVLHEGTGRKHASLDPNNVEVRKVKQTKEEKILALEDRIAVLQQQLEDLKRQQ